MLYRGEMKSPPNRTFYLTDSPWSSSSLPRGTSNVIQSSSYHGYQDSTVSSGRGSLFEGRETVDHYGSSSRGLDDSSYGTLEDRHKRSGSRDSLDQTSLGKWNKFFFQVMWRYVTLLKAIYILLYTWLDHVITQQICWCLWSWFFTGVALYKPYKVSEAFATLYLLKDLKIQHILLNFVLKTVYIVDFI